MADKKEGPKPKLYNPLLDRSIDDVLKDYQTLFTDKSQEMFRTEKTDDRDALYGRLIGHLSQHGVDKDKTGKETLKRQSYHDHKDKTKWAQTLVAELAAHGIAKNLGAAAVQAYLDPKNHHLLRQYVEQHMATDKIKNYDQIVDLFANSKNLRADFHEDTPIRDIIGNYVENINSGMRKRELLEQHLSKFENYEPIHKFVEGILKPHKLRPKKGAPLEALITTIPHATSPELHDRLKHFKHLEKIPEEKKK